MKYNHLQATSPVTNAKGALPKRLIDAYPSSKIICALGNMGAVKPGSPWPGYIEDAVSELGNKNIYTCFFPFKKTGGHPNVQEQKAMADILISFIEKNIKW